MPRQKAKLDITTSEVKPAVYLRVSTDEQAASGLGLAAQEARGRAMCQAKGWPDPVLYADEGISGTLWRDRRPALDMMLSAVESGTINAVIVLDLTRVARRASLIHNILDFLSAHNAVFVSCKENFDTSNSMGRAMLGVTAVFAQLERDLTAERTTAALAERKKLYGYASGPLPLGYMRENDIEGITIDPTGAEWVRYIFDLRSEGLSMQKIADAVNANKPWVKFYASTVKVILDNAPRYRGQIAHWPAILE